MAATQILALAAGSAMALGASFGGELATAVDPECPHFETALHRLTDQEPIDDIAEKAPLTHQIDDARVRVICPEVDRPAVDRPGVLPTDGPATVGDVSADLSVRVDVDVDVDPTGG